MSPLLPRLIRCRAFSTTPGQSPAPRRSRGFYAATFIIGATTGIAAYNYTSPPAPRLNPDTFTPYTLTEHKPVCTVPTHTSILTLTAPRSSPPPSFARDKLQSVQIKHPQVMIARSYTPLPPIADEDGGEEGEVTHTIRILLKREPAGEMSRYLFTLPRESTVELRGPQDEYILPPPDETTRLLFLAGGTGIAPALQCAHKLLGESRTSSMRILWAVRHRAETEGAVAEEVDRLKRAFGGRLQVGVFADAEGGVGRGTVRDGVEQWGAAKVVVSGPEGFVKYWAGEKGRWRFPDRVIADQRIISILLVLILLFLLLSTLIPRHLSDDSETYCICQSWT
ncbi:hypothetical protein BZA05DRAFT_435143 [Tricharina praecox]|uniref:uncharacterized protein n=1 Tax=Tricharina praecox TaxID=43433 RepID=UPI00221E8838|nr:uncharacterized protein BZA05DRAFT_435143 [Tricharina praecox]KAI5854977.1 hypothetical protein BZA05DRAFT_435143 [Tricharina praecox]